MRIACIYLNVNFCRKIWAQCGQECGQKFPPRCARFPPKAKKSLETLGFQGSILVEISGNEPLTS